MGRLAGLVSKTEGDIERLKDDMELKAEQANKAAVDLQVAQSDAAAALSASQQAQADADAASQAIVDAKTKAAAFAAASFRQGSVLGSMSAFMGAGSATELLQRQELLGQMSGSQLNVIANLESTRTHKANLDSAAKAALDAANASQAKADEAKAAADTAQQQAAESLQNGQDQLATLEAQHDQQQADYGAALANTAGLQNQRDQYNQWLAQKAAEEEAARQAAIAAAQAAAEEAARQAAARGRPAGCGSGRGRGRRAGSGRGRRGRGAGPGGSAGRRSRGGSRAAVGPAGAGQPGGQGRPGGAGRPGQRARSTPVVMTPGRPGVGPINRGDPAYRAALDPNNNGVACEGTAAVASAPAALRRAATGPTTPVAMTPGRPARARSTAAIPATGRPWTRTTTASPARAPSLPPPSAMWLSSSRTSSSADSGSRGEQVVAAAKAYLGTTYAWGGGDYDGPTLGIRDGGVADRYGDYKKIGFDCSGLALYAWAQVGVYLPHFSGYQYTGQPHVSRDQPAAG